MQSQTQSLGNWLQTKGIEEVRLGSSLTEIETLEVEAGSNRYKSKIIIRDLFKKYVLWFIAQPVPAAISIGVACSALTNSSLGFFIGSIGSCILAIFVSNYIGSDE